MAALLRNRSGILTRAFRGPLTAVLLMAVLPAPAAPAFLDAVLADVDGATVTASDVTFARALRLFGLAPSDALIGRDDVQRVVDSRLLADEARRLQMTPPPGDVQDAWRDAAERLGGMEVLHAWLDQAGLDEAWARRLVETDVRRRRFIEVRFRPFVFVTEEDLTTFLGSGAHTPDARERARQALREAGVARELAAWLAEARGRATIRHAEMGPATVPPPFAMPRDDRPAPAP